MAGITSEPPSDLNNSSGPGTAPRPLRKGPLPLELPILQHLKSKRVILASASPRRKALLQQVRRASPLTLYHSILTQCVVWPHKPRDHPVHET
jgi:hypothetical protein